MSSVKVWSLRDYVSSSQYQIWSFLLHPSQSTPVPFVVIDFTFSFKKNNSISHMKIKNYQFSFMPFERSVYSMYASHGTVRVASNDLICLLVISNELILLVVVEFAVVSSKISIKNECVEKVKG